MKVQALKSVQKNIVHFFPVDFKAPLLGTLTYAIVYKTSTKLVEYESLRVSNGQVNVEYSGSVYY